MYKVFLVDDEIVVREGIRSNFPWEETDFVLAGEKAGAKLDKANALGVTVITEAQFLAMLEGGEVL